MTAVAASHELRGAPRFPGATLELDATGQILRAWLGSAAPALATTGDVLVALDVDDTTPDAARVQLLLASLIGSPTEAWPLVAGEAPSTLHRRDGTQLAVLWEPIADGDMLCGVAMFVLPVAAPVLEIEDPAEANRLCVDALALLDECEAGLRHLQADHRARHAVHRMFRAIHTIKGSTRGTQLRSVAALAHDTEELVEMLRRDGDASPQILAQIGEAVDRLRAAVTAARPRGEVDDAMTELLSECRPVLVELHLAVSKLTDGEREAAAAATRAIDLIRVASERAGMGALRTQCMVAANAVEMIEFGSEFAPALIEEIAMLDRQIELYAAVYREVSASDTGPSVLITLASWGAANPHAEITSGPSESLDEFVGVMAKAGVPSLIEAFVDDDPRSRQRGVALLVDASAMFEPGRPRDEAALRFERVQRDLYGALDRLARSVPRARLDELRAIAERMVWVPLSVVARRLARMTRTLGSELNKSVAAKVELGDLAVAPEIARVLGEIMIHAVRNAVDHGIEHPSEREACGKDPKGTIHVEAYAMDDRVLITVRDDGRGVAIERVRRLAVERNLMSAETAAAAGDAALIDLLFSPGFSTASMVTAVSGRGVGMDVIRSLAEAHGGTVALVSRPGQGTELTIDLPLAPPPPPPEPGAETIPARSQLLPRLGM